MRPLFPALRNPLHVPSLSPSQPSPPGSPLSLAWGPGDPRPGVGQGRRLQTHGSFHPCLAGLSCPGRDAGMGGRPRTAPGPPVLHVLGWGFLSSLGTRWSHTQVGMERSGFAPCSPPPAALCPAEVSPAGTETRSSSPGPAAGWWLWGMTAPMGAAAAGSHQWLHPTATTSPTLAHCHPTCKPGPGRILPLLVSCP